MVTQIKESPFFAQPQAPPEDAQPAEKEANLPNVAQVAVEYVHSPDGLRELVVEPVIHSLRWMEIAVAAFGELVKGPQKLFESAGHLLLWAELPGQLLKWGKSVVQLGESIANKALAQTVDKAAKVYVNTTFLTGIVADAVQILYNEHAITLSAPALVAVQVLGVMGSFALLVNAIRGIKKQTTKLMASEPWSPTFNLALLRLSAKVALIVVAIFSIAAFFSAIVYFTWIILIFSSILLLLSLAAHFYDKTHFPDKDKAQSSVVS